MVEPGELRSHLSVGVDVDVGGVLERPRVESDGGAFFGEEDGVQVREHVLEAAHRPGLAGVDDAFPAFRFGGLRAPVAVLVGAGGDLDDGAAGFDLDVFERTAVDEEAVDAQVAGAAGDEVEDESLLAADAEHVAFGGMGLAHLSDTTPALDDLGDITSAIYATVDRMALRVGELVDRGRRVAGTKREYERWVREDLPFGLDTAKRLRAIYLAYEELPPAVLERMPRPWQALYALVAVDRPVLEAAVADGRVRPELTVEETRELARDLRGQPSRPRSRLDGLVERITAFPVEDLSQSAQERLWCWLGGGEDRI